MGEYDLNANFKKSDFFRILVEVFPSSQEKKRFILRSEFQYSVYVTKVI